VTNSRAAAVGMLVSMREQGVSLNAALSDSATPFLKELVYGVTRWYWRLQASADGLLDKPLRKKDSDLNVLILVGLYQLWKLSIPAHAAINETVKACEQLGKSWARGLVNAVLRSYVRSGGEVCSGLSDEARFSHPSWLLAHIRESWPEYWREILTANNERAAMVLRVNCQRIDRAGYLEELARCGLGGRPDDLSSHGVVLDTPVPVHGLPGFSEGRVSVQDTAAQWAAALLPLKAGGRVLDACAAPGGKLTHILEAHPEAGLALAIDISAKRIELIRENLDRLGVRAELRVADAGEPESWWDGTRFDCVVLDAPCTGSGVIRRRPDIKHLRRPGDLAQMVDRQALLLERLWQTVAPHGYLLYITCSVFPEENANQVQRFCAGRSDLDICPIQAPAGLHGSLGVQTLPGIHKVDGFFYSLMRKKEA
jgi:16S rRNA (cytosine967-C5)-methyltransferase